MLAVPNPFHPMKAKLLAPLGAPPPQWSDTCIYTVSINPTGDRDELIVAGYQWVRGQFRSVICLVGDGPLIERTARVTGRDIAAVAGRASRLAEGFEEACRVSELACTAEFEAAHADVQLARRQFPRLSRAIRADARAYVARIRKRGELALDVADAVGASVEYLELELATYLCLARRGLFLDSYLGDELPVLGKFIAGKLPGILPLLERRIFLGLTPRQP
jgi:hypothetical protein